MQNEVMDIRAEQWRKIILEAKSSELTIKEWLIRNNYPCYYGTDVPTSSQLIASGHSTEDIRARIGADSLKYLKLEDLDHMAGGKTICKACFDGCYPCKNS